MTEPVIVYLADEAYAVDLQFSLGSWRRFVSLPAAVVDLGLSPGSRRRLEERFGHIRWVSPKPPEVPYRDGRDRAYSFKAQCGSLVSGDPIVFLDADIAVVDPQFFKALLTVEENAVLASPSAWDRDLTWTYQSDALQSLRSITGMAELAASFELPNSGVWSMRSRTAAVVAATWSAMLSQALSSSDLRQRLTPGRRVGDQEFLGLAARRLGVKWQRLHGSHNMQVHESRMPWITNESEVQGGHIGEHPEKVRAVHYRYTPDVGIEIDESLIRSETIRNWLRDQYEEIRHAAFEGKRQ